MKLTEIIEPKKRKDEFKLIFDFDTEYFVSKEVFFKRNFKVNDEIEVSELLELINDDKKVKAREISLSYLDRGLKSKKEIENKLVENDIPKEIIEETIEKIEDYGYVDDSHLTKVYIEDKLYSRGKVRIKNELLKKGIDKEVIDEVFTDEYKQKEADFLYDIALRKYNSLIKRESDGYKLKEKLIRFLLSKGYEYDLIKSTLNKILNSSLDEY